MSLLQFYFKHSAKMLSGDLCDSDKDGDGVVDEQDNCVYVANPLQQHTINYDMQGMWCAYANI